MTTKKGKTNRKRNRKMCHDNYSGCRPEVKIEHSEKMIEKISYGKYPEYDYIPCIHHLHYKCTKTNEEPYLIEEITGDEKQ